MTSRLNDHRALTEKRREEIENAAYQVAMTHAEFPDHPAPTVDGELLVDLLGHVGVLDQRIRNFSAIFQAVQRLADDLGKPELKDQLVSVPEIARALTQTIQGALLPPQEGA